MYRFVTVSGSCGSPVSILKAEQTANSMQGQGFELVEAFQTTTKGCTTANHAILMIFKDRNGVAVQSR